MSKRSYDSDSYRSNDRHRNGSSGSGGNSGGRWDYEQRSSSSSHGGGGGGHDHGHGHGRDHHSNNGNSRPDREREERKRKRKSRWGGDESEKIFIPGMPTIIPSNMDKKQEEIYLLQIQIEALTRRLLTNDLGISENPDERSPSPEPIYNSDGKRLNTREYRYRKKFEEERHNCVLKMTELNPTYKPPIDYKPPQSKICEKVLIPQEEYPDINFVGLIIGPRGNTLKGMERDTSAKIIIRGKGSVKEGKLARKDGQPLPGEDEPLHAFVTGPTQESVAQAVMKINEVIKKGIELPENMNDLRRSQLRELALLNGTLREHDGPRCTNCGAQDHRSWQCPDKPNVTNNVFCTNCNGAGHIAKDCKEARASGAGDGGGGASNTQIDQEYLTLMAELGEGDAPRDTGRDRRDHGREEPQLNSIKPLNPEKIQAAQAAQAAQQQQQHGNNMPPPMAPGAAGAAAAWSGYGAAGAYDPYGFMSMWADPNAWATAGHDPAAAANSQWWQWYAATSAGASGATTAGVDPYGAAAPPPPPPPPPPPSTR